MSARLKLTWLYVLHFAGLGLGLVTVPWAAYYLGMFEMGRFAYGATAYLLAVLVADMGTDTWLISRLAKDTQLKTEASLEAMRDASSLRTTAMLCAFLLLGALLVAVPSLRRDAGVFLASLLPLLALPFGVAAMTRITGLQLMEAGWTAGWRLTAAIFVVVVLPLSPTAEAFALISGGSSLGLYLTLAFILHRRGYPNVYTPPALRRIRRIFTEIRSLSLSRYCGAVYSLLPPYVLGYFHSTEAAGIWQVADRFLKAGLALFAPLASILHPKLAALTDERIFTTDASRLLRLSALLYGGLSALTAGGIATLTAVVVTTGLPDARIAPVMGIFAATMLVLGATHFLNSSILLPCMNFRAVLAAQSIGAFVFVLLAPGLAVTWAAPGMATAYLIAEAFVAIELARAARGHLPRPAA